MSGNKCFSRFEYHMFYVLYPFVTYLLSLPRRNDTAYDLLCYSWEMALNVGLDVSFDNM
jgi:hypothetical protein